MLPDKQLTEFDRALLTARHFGFLPIAAPKIAREDLELTRHCGDHPHYDAADKAALLRAYLAWNFDPASHPLAIAYKKPASRKKYGDYALHFIGLPSALAEAALVRTTLSILSEEGHKSLRVDINCIGDKESINTYEKGLASHIRKLDVDISDSLKQSIKEDVFNLFKIETPETLLLRETIPSSITFLSSQSRAYFKEVLEYMEALGIEFRLTPKLIGEKNHASHTIFAIRDSEDESENVLAIGYRYSRLARHFGLRKEIPMAGVTVFSSGKNGGGRLYKNLPKPKFYLIQIGLAAKIRTLSLIELLRSHRIPVHHFLGRDKITAQLAEADNLKVSYLIIVGQKEAIDNTATIRNVATRAQDTVSIAELPHYLKNIKL